MRDTTKLLDTTKAHRFDDDTSSSSSSSPLSIGTKEISWTNSRKLAKLKKQRCKTNLLHFCWIAIGIFLFIGSIQVLWAPQALENIVHTGISNAFVFTQPKPEDDNYQKWVSNQQADPQDSIPINVYIQFFNVTNPADLLNGSLPEHQRLPKFNLTAPIVYDQYYYRENISFSADGTMSRSYFKTRFYHNTELSETMENENFTIFAPLVGAGVHYAEKNPNPEGIEKWLTDGFLQWLDSDDGDNLLTTATAHDLIFNILDFKYPQNDTKIPLGPTIKAGALIDYKYGMLKNGSGSWYISHTGYEDESRMGEVLKWSNQPQNWQYSENDPTLINFDDENFTYIDCWWPHQPYSPNHFIYMGIWSIKDDPDNAPPFFISTLKKALEVDHYKSVKYQGIPTEQFNVSTGRQFMNESLYPPNAQYYQFGPSGVFNMTHCFSELPLFFSLPKFYGAPDFAANNSKMNIPEPNPETDNGFFMIEPMTGAILNAEVALQGNTPINPLPYYGVNVSKETPSLTFLPSGLMAPTYLLTYKAHLPEKGAKELSKQINLANNLDLSFYYFAYVCWGLAVLYWSFSMYWCGRNGVKKMFPGLCCPLKEQLQDSSI